jgi:hypothetical protein
VGNALFPAKRHQRIFQIRKPDVNAHRPIVQFYVYPSVIFKADHFVDTNDLPGFALGLDFFTKEVVVTHDAWLETRSQLPGDYIPLVTGTGDQVRPIWPVVLVAVLLLR